MKSNKKRKRVTKNSQTALVAIDAKTIMEKENFHRNKLQITWNILKERKIKQFLTRTEIMKAILEKYEKIPEDENVQQVDLTQDEK